MATKFDATRPLFALVGAGDLAVEFARTATADVQARFSKVDLEPAALREQARTAVATGIDEVAKDAKGARSGVESRARQTRKQLEGYVNDAVAEVTETYGDLAGRGERLVARIRRQQATQDAKAAAKTTRAKARTTKTQTAKSAKSTAGTAKKSATQASKSTSQSAKKTTTTAKRDAKSTATAARKTAESTTQAASDAAAKTGN
jgi:hypothetical protein